MAVAARRDTRMTVAEFRLWAEPRPDEERWELIDGIALLMSPPTGRHQRIVMNLGRRLDELAERRGRNALPGLGVLSAAMDDFAPIPDIVVTFGPLGQDGYTSAPLLVAEVLSPSTMRSRSWPQDRFLPLCAEPADLPHRFAGRGQGRGLAPDRGGELDGRGPVP